ncbi:MAG TPA: hypothetical protein VE954_28495 [Oligoflexus sp.]|uniref:hypothetical protein n=1 Tax=Oligoflexus sp. TaxID=1971216 RepID=UPI002D657BA5|nr:hypothetical protein [Oligoflexus sp.]HYX37060.1 hypothetical protein [Oligoflexus sp.]
MKKLLLLTLLLASQGCVTPAICTQEGAFDLGRQQALAGKQADPSQGQVCEGETSETFRTNYKKGYDTGFQLLCSAQNATDDGRDAGLQGQSLTGLPLRYQLCVKDRTGLEKSFMSAYQRGLEEHCSADTAKNRGDQAGRKNQATLDIDATYISCPQPQRSKLKQAYQKAFMQGLRAYCQPTQHLETIRNLAKTATQPSHDPQTYGSCAQHFPDLLEEYHAVFYRERDGVVQRLCTYENGLNDGQTDATQSNQRRHGVPDFCDDRQSSGYMRGYDRGWSDKKREVCLQQDLHEQGFRDGANGLAANPHFPELCPSDYYRVMRNRYDAGYERGRRQSSHRPHQESKGEDVVRACGQVFSFDSEKLECIQHSRKIRYAPSDVVEACGQAFSFSSDRMKCIISATGRSYNSATVVRSCKQATAFASELQKCITTVQDARYEPSRAINACQAAFSMNSDRQECWNVIAKEPRDPSAKIQSCQQSFNFSSDILRCIRT